MEYATTFYIDYAFISSHQGASVAPDASTNGSHSGHTGYVRRAELYAEKGFAHVPATDSRAARRIPHCARELHYTRNIVAVLVFKRFKI